MPWIAIPFDDKERREKLGEAFNVSGIPFLVVVGKDGKIIDTKAR